MEEERAGTLRPEPENWGASAISTTLTPPGVPNRVTAAAVVVPASGSSRGGVAAGSRDARRCPAGTSDERRRKEATLDRCNTLLLFLWPLPSSVALLGKWRTERKR